MAAQGESRHERQSFAVALEAGLEVAVSQFPEDVAAAAQIAVEARRALPGLEEVTAEPWPPMHVQGTR